MIGKALKRLGAAKMVGLRVHLMALWKLARHPQTPRSAKWVAFAVIAYAVSPIDLIPDFIPVIGLLDDVVLIPLGVALVVRLTPQPLWNELLAQARASSEKLPSLWWGAAAIAAVWVAVVALAGWAALRWFAPG